MAARRRPSRPSTRLVDVPKARPAKVTVLPAHGPHDRRLRAQIPIAPEWIKEAFADLLVDIVPALKRLGAIAVTIAPFV